MPPPGPARTSRLPPLLYNAGRGTWDLLTAPSARVERPEEQRRARMLAALLVFLMLAAALLTFIVPWWVRPGQADANRTLALVGAVVLALGGAIYAISRTRHYEVAAGLMVASTLASCTFSILISQGTVWGSGAPYFLTLAVVLSAVLLSVTMTVIVAFTAVTALLLLYAVLPGFGALTLSNSLAFLGLFSAVLVLTSLVRHQDLRQIEDQGRRIAEDEERYRSLFEASFEGLALHADGHIIEANETLARLFGHPRDEMVGMPIDRFVEPASRPHLHHKTRTSAHETHEATAVAADGRVFPVEFISKPYLFRGRLVRVTGFRDISARREAEEARRKSAELAAANRRLLEVDRLKTHILNTASHELNTPITPLRLQVHLLKGGQLGHMNARQLRAVEVLDRNLGRLSHLVSDMLDVSRVQDGRLRLERRVVDLDALIDDTVVVYAPVADERDLVLDASGASGLWVDADPSRVTQVLHNLLSNALKFTPPGGHVSVRVTAQDGRAQVDVVDTGLGLSAEQRARLFRPFEQVHEIARTERGSGLGLYICKGIVEEHGGRLSVHSDGPGKGCRFSFTLPLAHTDPTARDDTARDDAQDLPLSR